MPSPNPGTGTNALSAVYSASPSDAWAVGSFHNGNHVGLPLVLRWNGSSWSTVKVPSVSSVENVFYAVSGTSATDIWAAGNEYDSGASQWLPFVEHWDGSAWTISSTPDLGAGDTYFRGVAAITPSDAWLVGYRNAGSAPTLTEHWDGSSWSVVPATGGELDAVAALSSSDVWAVGQGAGSPLTLHWDGSSWSSFPAPQGGPLFGAAALGGSNVWGVGDDDQQAPVEALADHWDGQQWTESFENQFPSQNVLSAVSASSPTDIWAVGSRLNYRSIFRTFIEHYDGAVWSPIASPNVNTRDDLFAGVSVDSTPGAWAVGWWTPRSGSARTLVARYC